MHHNLANPAKSEKNAFPIGETVLYYKKFMNVRRLSDEAY